jgi:putative FmdB family regulatory protein
MPTYDYQCEACGNRFEKFQSITAAPIRKCPKCGKNKVKRLISAGAGLIFKGSGFYITDYRSEGYKSAAKAESGGGGGDAKSGDAKSGDAKPTSGAESASTKPAAESKPAPKAEKPAAPKKK